jgi:hypothetical protein
MHSNVKLRRIITLGLTESGTESEGGQIMVNETQVEPSECGVKKSVEDSSQAILSHGPGWLILALALACGIGFLGSSAFLRNYGVTSSELRLILMLLLFPVEWGGALLILALVGDLKRAAGKKKIPSSG